MRTVLVGPIDERVHLPDHGFSPCGDNDPFQPVFDGSNGSLQNGNAAVLPDRTESRSNVVLAAPVNAVRNGRSRAGRKGFTNRVLERNKRIKIEFSDSKRQAKRPLLTI